MRHNSLCPAPSIMGKDQTAVGGLLMCNLLQTPLFAFLNPPNGSWGIVNVQPSNTNNTHRPNFPNNVKLKIDSSNHFAEFIRSANLSIAPLAFHSC